MAFLSGGTLLITTQKVGNRTVYWTDSDKEWQHLVGRGHVVYTADETALLAAHPQVLTEENRTLLFQLKILAPVVRLVGVKPT